MNIMPDIGTAIILQNIKILSGFNSRCGKQTLFNRDIEGFYQSENVWKKDKHFIHC